MLLTCWDFIDVSNPELRLHVSFMNISVVEDVTSSVSMCTETPRMSPHLSSPPHTLPLSSVVLSSSSSADVHDGRFEFVSFGFELRCMFE